MLKTTGLAAWDAVLAPPPVCKTASLCSYPGRCDVLVNLSLVLWAVHHVRPLASLLGWSILISRSTAKCLNVATALLPLCTDVIAVLQHTPLGVFLPISERTCIHRVAGAVALVAGVIHSVCHYFNYQARLSFHPSSSALTNRHQWQRAAAGV